MVKQNIEKGTTMLLFAFLKLEFFKQKKNTKNPIGLLRMTMVMGELYMTTNSVWIKF